MIPPMAEMLNCRTVEELMGKFPSIEVDTARRIIHFAFNLIEEWQRELVEHRIGPSRAMALSRLTERQQHLIFNDEKGIR